MYLFISYDLLIKLEIILFVRKKVTAYILYIYSYFLFY